MKDTIDPQDALMVAGDRAATLAGITRQRLWYWERIGLVKPTVRRQLSPRNIVRLYALPELTELLVAANLRNAPRITLQHMRKVLDYLRDRYDSPLREVSFAVHDGEIFIKPSEGGWSHGLTGQGIFEHTVPLHEIKARARKLLNQGRQPSDFGQVVKLKGVMGSKPVFKGTRVPVDAVLSFFRAGRSLPDILEAYPQLSEEDLSKALLLSSVQRRLAMGQTPETIFTLYPNLTADEIRSATQIQAA